MKFLKNLFSKDRDVAVLSLDGVPGSLLKEFLNQGVLPNLEEVFSNGTLRKMNSVRPTVSSCAWSSFMTGKNPGGHNIYGFIDRTPETGELYIPNAEYLYSSTIWELLSDAGKKVCGINVPVTYPPEEVNGIMIAGFLAPEAQKATRDIPTKKKMEDIDYILDVETGEAADFGGKFIEELNKAVNKRFEMMGYLKNREDWDFFMGHIMSTDRLHHFMWEELKKGEGKLHDAFLNFYRNLDRQIGEFRDSLNSNTRLIVLSDHGFCSVKEKFYINHWLEKEGFLTTTDSGEMLEAVSSESLAYSLIPGRIYINLKGREANGSVSNGEEYDRVREDISMKLETVKKDGETVIKQVYRKEDIFTGKSSSNAPDLLAVPNRGYDIKGQMNTDTMFDKGSITGMHTYDDAFMFTTGGGNIPKKSFDITFLLPCILEEMNVKIPKDIQWEDYFH